MSDRPWIVARPAYSDPDPKYPRPKYLSIGDVWALHPHLALKFASESEAKAYARGLPGAPSTITGQLLESPEELADVGRKFHRREIANLTADQVTVVPGSVTATKDGYTITMIDGFGSPVERVTLDLDQNVVSREPQTPSDQLKESHQVKAHELTERLQSYVVMKLINNSAEFLAGVTKDGGIAVHFTHDAEDAPHFDTEEQAEAFLATAVATLGASNFKMTGVFIGRAVPIPYEEKLALLRRKYDNLVELRASMEERGSVTDDHIHVCDEAFEVLAQHIRSQP